MTTDTIPQTVSVPGSVRQATARPVRPGAGEFRRRGGPAQGGRARVRPVQGAGRVSDRPPRAGEDPAHAGGPDRPAGRHRPRASGLQRCGPSRRRPDPQAAARQGPAGGRVAGFAADAVAVREHGRPRRALPHGVGVGRAGRRAASPPPRRAGAAHHDRSGPDRRPDARRAAHPVQRVLRQLVLPAAAGVSVFRPRIRAVSVRGAAAARQGGRLGRRRRPEQAGGGQ